MNGKRSPGCWAYAAFSIAIFALMITMWVLSIPEANTLGIYGSCILFFFWIFVNTRISKKQREKLPLLEVNATLVGKVQNNTRSGSLYFLTFDLEDGSRKTFRAELSDYAGLTEKEAGVLKYKHIDLKRDHYLSYQFVKFEKKSD